MTRRYGQWAGNPRGWPEDVERCVESVFSGMRSRQCTRRRGHGPEGLYCRQHGRLEEERRARRQERG